MLSSIALVEIKLEVLSEALLNVPFKFGHSCRISQEEIMGQF